MKRSRNRNVIFTGRVGTKMRARRHAATRKVVKQSFDLIGGPLHGFKAWLQSDGGTLPIVCRGEVGIYRGGRWRPAGAEAAA